MSPVMHRASPHRQSDEVGSRGRRWRQESHARGRTVIARPIDGAFVTKRILLYGLQVTSRR